MSFGSCEECGANLQIDRCNEATFGERYCPKCGLVVPVTEVEILSNPDLRIAMDYRVKEETEIPEDLRLGDIGEPSMNTSIVKDKKTGELRVAGALWLEKEREKNLTRSKKR